MTNLYRGLLLVLTSKFNELIVSLRTHVQSFNQNTKDENSYFDFGVLGFWNLMLEVTFTIFSLTCLLLGVILVSILSIIFYPCYAILRYASFVLNNTRNPLPEVPILQDQIQAHEKTPVIVKKENNGL